MVPVMTLTEGRIPKLRVTAGADFRDHWGSDKPWQPLLLPRSLAHSGFNRFIQQILNPLISMHLRIVIGDNAGPNNSLVICQLCWSFVPRKRFEAL